MNGERVQHYNATSMVLLLWFIFIIQVSGMSKRLFFLFLLSAILLLENFKSWWYIITSGAMGGILCSPAVVLHSYNVAVYVPEVHKLCKLLQEYLHTEVSPIKFLPFLCMVFPLAFCVMWKLLGKKCILFPDVTNCQMEIFPLRVL